MILPNNSLTKNAEYINLKNLELAKYSIIYKLDKAYSINAIEEISNNYQFHFVEIDNTNQHLNLIIIDSLFPLILGDLCKHVLTKKISSINQFISLKDKISVIDKKHENIFYKRKFEDFIDLLLYTNLGSFKPFYYTISSNKIFCIKDKNGELQFFNYYEKQNLIELVFDTLNFEIDLVNSQIKDRKLNLRVALKLNN